MKEELRVQRIKDQILELGPILPGSLSEQWNASIAPKPARAPVAHRSALGFCRPQAPYSSID
jgi:hypothetical protein